MKCVKFRLIQIRNMEDTTILPDEGLTIFTGENGSGKTNLIEAVYYASIGKSFRTGNDNEMIRLGMRKAPSSSTSPSATSRIPSK